ncbi:hypothetical protein B0H63DRAFT_449692 [Podospora didyma]|uniref:Uncharacterized protein n=1 Tax=Podospora didyma TaxID=330526 RepID=A0AAE0NQ50_9PEZI|nr:hypothetical protein B0H63DRAFT_449692 [Podospora didyma]
MSYGPNLNPDENKAAYSNRQVAYIAAEQLSSHPDEIEVNFNDGAPKVKDLKAWVSKIRALGKPALFSVDRAEEKVRPTRKSSTQLTRLARRHELSSPANATVVDARHTVDGAKKIVVGARNIVVNARNSPVSEDEAAGHKLSNGGTSTGEDSGVYIREDVRGDVREDVASTSNNSTGLFMTPAQTPFSSTRCAACVGVDSQRRC